MPTFVGSFLDGIKNNFKKINFRAFFENIGPGGKYFKYFIGVLAVLGAFVIVATLFITNVIKLPIPSKSPAPVSVPFAKPTILPLPQGFQSWSTYGPGPSTGPKLQKATVDTLTPPKGSTQTVTVALTSDSPVTKVTAILFTDNKYEINQMNLTKGTNTNGTWTGIWRINDTYDYVYHVNFIFESANGVTNRSALSFR